MCLLVYIAVSPFVWAQQNIISESKQWSNSCRKLHIVSADFLLFIKKIKKKNEKIKIISKNSFIKFFCHFEFFKSNKNRNVFERIEKENERTRAWPFVLVKFNSCLKVINRTQQARTYFFERVQIYTLHLRRVSASHTLYSIYTHSTSTAAAAARIWVARKLYICQTNKRTNVLITLCVATKRKLQQKSVHQQQRRRLQSYTIVNTHCSETEHPTPHATSTAQSIFNVLSL